MTPETLLKQIERSLIHKTLALRRKDPKISGKTLSNFLEMHYTGCP